MHERVIIAGAGGQGIILTGKLLASAALQHVAHITFFPSYGAEVRGGVSKCQVVLSSEEIASPVSARFDSAIIMNQASLDRYLPNVEPGGVVIVNASLCRPPPGTAAVAVPATEQAIELGDVRVANFIMLGACLRMKPLVPSSTLAVHSQD